MDDSVNAIVDRYIQVVNDEKAIKKEKEMLRWILIESFGDDDIKTNWYTVKKSIVNKTVLKEWVELSQIVEKLWGGAIKQEPNMAFLKESPEAFEFLELKEEIKFLVTKDKPKDVVQD